MIRVLIFLWVMMFGTIVVVDNTPCIGAYRDFKKMFLAFSSLIFTPIAMYFLFKAFFGDTL